MKVSKLIELLKDMPQNAKVMVIKDFEVRDAKDVLVDNDEKFVHISAHTVSELSKKSYPDW